ncbi:acyl-CoA thioesterase [Aeromicrobium sp. CF3.5]|uniref:acyl-CoA thioesterase n=1 Tax=Aeromicrobium sp. CF3.5 TaxID=3373078 RepID=UPI003EE56A25
MDDSPHATRAPAVTLDDLLEALDLEPFDPGLDARRRTTRWRGGTQTFPEDRVFGGLLLAQSLVAAGRTVDPAQRVVSLQADFLAGVPTGRDLTWEVEPLSEATSLSTRRSTLRDDDGAVRFTATTRWSTTRSDLPSHAPRVPRSAPSPDGLSTLVDRFGDDIRVPAWWRIERPVEFRHVEPPAYVEPVAPGGDAQSAWVRTTGPLPADPVVRAGLIAYVSDMSILEPAFRALGAARHAPDSRILSLTHAMIFHCEVDLGRWHQVDARIDAMTHGRCLGIGELFDDQGRHVVSATQLGLVKLAGITPDWA